MVVYSVPLDAVFWDLTCYAKDLQYLAAMDSTYSGERFVRSKSLSLLASLRVEELNTVSILGGLEANSHLNPVPDLGHWTIIPQSTTISYNDSGLLSHGAQVRLCPLSSPLSGVYS